MDTNAKLSWEDISQTPDQQSGFLIPDDGWTIWQGTKN